MTTVLQFTDTHLSRAGSFVSRKLNTRDCFIRLVQRVQEVAHQIEPVDAIVVTGDVSDDGSAESYVIFRSLAAVLDAPLFVIPGNHDRREAMRAAFGADGYLPPAGKLNWRGSAGDITLIGLDTLIEGEGGGEFDDETFAFLQSALGDAGEAPVLLALHHPPFRTGIQFMDRIGLKGSDQLAAVLTAHQGPLRGICGHIHCAMVAEVGGKIAMSGPSPASSFPMDLRDGAAAGFMTEPDGFMVHVWQDGFTSTRIGIAGGDGPFPF